MSKTTQYSEEQIANSRRFVGGKTRLRVKWLWHRANDWLLELEDGKTVEFSRSWTSQSYFRSQVMEALHVSVDHLDRDYWNATVREFSFLIRDHESRLAMNGPAKV